MSSATFLARRTSSAQAAASRLRVYTPGGGWKDAGGGAVAALSLSGDLRRGWSLFGLGNYSRLLGEFGRSPVVRDRKGEYRKELLELRKQGFQRVKVDGTYHEIDDVPALDKKLRSQMQLELVDIIEKSGVTCVMVTNDQEEAMTMATRIVVMDAGWIKQVGKPDEVYEQARKVLSEEQFTVIAWTAAGINLLNRLGVTSRKPLPAA